MLKLIDSIITLIFALEIFLKCIAYGMILNFSSFLLRSYWYFNII